MNSSELIINIKLEVYCSLKFISSIICSSCVRVHTPCLHTSSHSNGKHRDKHLKRNAIINLLIDTWIKHATNEKEYQTVSNIYQGQIVSNMRMVMPHTTLHLKKKKHLRSVLDWVCLSLKVTTWHSVAFVHWGFPVILGSVFPLTFYIARGLRLPHLAYFI